MAAQNHGTKFPILCCCLLTLIFTAGHVYSTGGQHDQQPPSASSPSQPEPSASRANYNFEANDKHPDFPNIYPLSVDQYNAGVDQRIMAKRISAQNGTFNKGLGFHPELQEIVQGLVEHLPNLYGQYMSKSWPQLLRDLMEEAIGNTKADNTDLLFEILVTTTNAQKQEMGLYNSDICDRMLKHPVVKRKENRGYQTLMWHLCKVPRKVDYCHGNNAAYEIINAIKEYIEKETNGKHRIIDYVTSLTMSLTTQNQKIEKKIGQLLAQHNYTQLRVAFEMAYAVMENDTVSARLREMMKIEKNREKHILQAINAIHMDVKQGRPEFLFHLFDRIFEKSEKDKDMDTFLRDIGRLLITHAQVDLADIGTNNLNKLKDWLTSVMTLNLNGNRRTSTEQHRQLAAFIQIVKLVEDENWKKHFEKTD